MKKIFLLLSLFCLSACGTRNVKILDASWTSMKHSMPPSSEQKLTRVSNINTEFCVSSWSGNYGLMDEAVKKAESQFEIDYIKHPSFSQSMNKPCVQVSGEGYRILR